MGWKLPGWVLPVFLLSQLIAGPALAEEIPYPQIKAVAPQDRVRTEIPYRGGKVVLLADFQERVNKTRYRARGRVEITYQDTLITCDQAEYDEATGEGFTVGSTRFSQGKQWLSCSRAEFNFRDQTGTFYDASGYTDNEFLVRGRTVVKTGTDTYKVEGSFITACPGNRPKWAFNAASTNIRVDRTARMRHMVFRVKGVPVLYFPYLIVPLEKKERSSGLLPFHTGNSTSKGRVFSMGYFQTLGPSADATIYGEYFTLRGLAVGGVFRARPNPQTRLYVQAYGIKDRLDQGGTHVIVDGESLLGNGFRAVARVNLTSSFQFRQAFADTFRAATVPLDNSVLFMTKNHGSYSTSISFQRDEVLFPGRSLVIRRFPSIEFASLQHPIGHTPFVFSLQSSLSGFSRIDSTMETPQVVQRLDFHPRLDLRLPAIAGFSLIPSLGFRETYYSGRKSDSPQPEYISRGLSRRYGEFELDLRTPTLEKKYETAWLGKFTHVIEPIATYRRIRGINMFHETLRFDDQDAIADTNEVEYGVFNRILRTREIKPGINRQYEFLSVGVMQKYFFDPSFGGAFRNGEANIFYPLNTLTGFSLTGIQRNMAPASIFARISPASGISYDARADFDTRLQKLRDASLSMYWQREMLYASGTYFKTQAIEPNTFESHHMQGQIGYGSVLRGLSASLTFSYNIRSEKLLNSQSRVNYMWDCCGLSMEFQQFDLGSRTESRFSFSFTLKGIGSFGNIKRPESVF